MIGEAPWGVVPWGALATVAPPAEDFDFPAALEHELRCVMPAQATLVCTMPAHGAIVGVMPEQDSIVCRLKG